MLVLAVHSVSEVTAKVPFSTILLQDFIANKKVPEDFHNRMLVPTSGSTSCSLWDVQDSAALLAWLNENIGVDCQHEVHEVQEDFGIGLAEVFRQRAMEKVSSGTKDVTKVLGGAAAATAQSMHDLDNRLKISDRATQAVEVVKDSAVVQSTAAALGKAGASVRMAGKKVLDQPAVAQATEAVGSGFRKLTSLIGRGEDNNTTNNTSSGSLAPLGEAVAPPAATSASNNNP